MGRGASDQPVAAGGRACATNTTRSCRAQFPAPSTSVGSVANRRCERTLLRVLGSPAGGPCASDVWLWRWWCAGEDIARLQGLAGSARPAATEASSTSERRSVVAPSEELRNEMNALADAIAAPFGVDVATRSAPEAPPPAPQATAATTAAAQHEPQFPQPHPPAEHSSSPNPSPRSSRHHVAMQPGNGVDDTAGDAMDGGASDGHASWADGAHLVAGRRRSQPPPPTVPPPGMPLGLRQSHGHGGDGLGASGHDAFSHGIARVEPPVPPAPVARSVPPPQPSQLPWRWPPAGAPAESQFSVPVAPQLGIEQA